MKTPDELQIQLQKSFTLPHIMKLASLSSWPSEPPILAQYNELVPEMCKLPYEYVFKTDGRALAEGALLVWEYFGFDMPFAIVESYSMEAQSIGARINFYNDHIPDVDRNHLLIKDESDFDKIRFNGLDSGRYPYLMEYWDSFIDYSGVPGFPEICAPWSLAANIYGMQNLLIACLTEPEFVHNMMDRIVCNLLVPLITELKKHYQGAADFKLADAWCSPPMVTKDIIDEFIVPYLLKLKAAIGADLPFTHAAVWVPDSNPVQKEAFMNLIASFGGSINGFEPELLRIGPKYFRKYADERKLPLMLYTSPSFIETASAQEAAERGKLYALEGKKGETPYAIGFGCIPPHTPPENVRSFIKAVRTYGALEADENTPFSLPDEDITFEEFVRSKVKNNTEGYLFNWLSKSGLKI